MSATLLLDKKQVRQSFSLAVNSYDKLASLQRTVGLQLLQQFSEEKIAGQVVDIGCGTGFLTQQLLEQPFVRQIIAIDIAFSMVLRTRVKLDKNTQYICADAENIPLQKQVIDTIVSNLALQWCQNLTAVFNGFKNTLKTEGQLLFSTFGPATLKELKRAWAEVDGYTHVNDFYSMDDLFGFLTQSGFKNIRIESKVYQSSYQSVTELMRELKGIGAHNVLSNRNRKTTSKGSMQAMISAYEKNRVDGRILATYEIFFVSARVA